MVRRMGRGIAERHPDVNEIIEYDEDEIFLDMRSGDSNRLLHAYEVADAQVRALRGARFDRAYNVTHSFASAMLLKLADIPEVVGAHLTDDWQFVLRGPWTTYFFMSVFHREFNDLNLCDIVRHFEPEAAVRELVFDVRDSDRERVDALLARHGIGPEEPFVCMQLGASEENKRWNEGHFAELAQRLQQRHGLRIVLVGVKEEAPLGQVFEQAAPGLAVHLYGETSIPELAALLERARILVTNDPGTMHVAAAVGCPITLVSVGHVHYRETGPWGEGHCAVEWRRDHLGTGHHVPTGLDERALVQPDHALAAVECTLAFRETGVLPRLEETPELRGLDLFMTRFAPDGCLEYYPLLRRAMTWRDFVRTAYRFMWLAHMDPQAAVTTERAAMDALVRCYDGPDAEQVAAWRDELDVVFEALETIAGRGVTATDELLGHMRAGESMTRARDLVHGLMGMDEEMRLHGELHPACKPLVVVARHERDNLEGADPARLAETTRAVYAACRARAALARAKVARLAEACVAPAGPET
jgi:ADP-heptose:LPS heptosyltransferase